MQIKCTGTSTEWDVFQFLSRTTVRAVYVMPMVHVHTCVCVCVCTHVQTRTHASPTERGEDIAPPSPRKLASPCSLSSPESEGVSQIGCWCFGHIRASLFSELLLVPSSKAAVPMGNARGHGCVQGLGESRRGGTCCSLLMS
jgi:hypothetical protein